MFYFKDETTSTNDDAREQIYTHGDVICAERQSAGRGQRGNKWISGEGKNITFSVVLEPSFLKANEQFLVSQITALALIDTMSEYGITATIKWTNDIYVGEHKIVGVLIENRLSGTTLSRAIIGVGININQREFDPSLPNPTSMILERANNEEIPRREVLETFYASLMRWYKELMTGDYASIDKAYHAKMYRRGEYHNYRLADGCLIRGVIQGVRPSGALVIMHDNDEEREYQFKEVEFVIEQRGR
ncbi:MAG: biotin--[acetyl-CoA-carboxylase] ligase [Rikenellaceae bacterium]